LDAQARGARHRVEVDREERPIDGQRVHGDGRITY
jgi:hypothetical protein